MRVEANERRLLGVVLRAFGVEGVRNGALGGALHVEIDRSLDDEIVLGLADEIRNLLDNPIENIIGAGARSFGDDVRAIVGVWCCGALGGRDELGLEHRVENEPRALPQGAKIGRALNLSCRRIIRRRLDEAGEHRGFDQCYVARGFTEIALGRRFDAEGARAEINAVEVDLEDLVLAQLVLEPHRKHRFFELALVGTLRRQEGDFGELLGDCRTALDDAVRLHVGHECAAHTDEVDGAMVIVSMILDREDGERQVARHLRERDEAAVRQASCADLLAVHVEDGVRRGLLVNEERFDVRKAVHQTRREDDSDEDRNNHA